ncbi:hypothetical protein EVAR_93036_1 [Eumeta japonica]|uniref:Uncharacterized protein n=1 Tax=Eumeta variegata TaxID=151549 RepID=A0A4C1TI06_EUMVA|nr:hypothetical protein EVAR_93036_1 [Eumeta japonica]
MENSMLVANCGRVARTSAAAAALEGRGTKPALLLPHLLILAKRNKCQARLGLGCAEAKRVSNHCDRLPRNNGSTTHTHATRYLIPPRNVL